MLRHCCCHTGGTDSYFTLNNFLSHFNQVSLDVCSFSIRGQSGIPWKQAFQAKQVIWKNCNGLCPNVFSHSPFSRDDGSFSLSNLFHVNGWQWLGSFWLLVYYCLSRDTPPLYQICAVNHGSEITSLYGIATSPACKQEEESIWNNRCRFQAVWTLLYGRIFGTGLKPVKNVCTCFRLLLFSTMWRDLDHTVVESRRGHSTMGTSTLFIQIASSLFSEYSWSNSLFFFLLLACL